MRRRIEARGKKREEVESHAAPYAIVLKDGVCRALQLIGIGKRITDYRTEAERQEEDKIDDDLGVAVVFGDESAEVCFA